MLKKFFRVSDEENYDEIYDDEGYEDVLEVEENVWQIALDILDNWNEMIILAPVAWIELKDIDLSFFNQVLTISWFRKKPEIYDEDVTVKNKECYWWKFSRKIILPENLNFEMISAWMENNLLIIRIPKLHFSSHNIKIDRL